MNGYYMELVEVFSGKKPCDLLLKGGRVVDVFSSEILEVPVAIHCGKVIALEELPAREVFDLSGRFISPGLADSHIHIESTMLIPYEFSRAVVRRGTTAVFCDPHEISNSLGEDGFEYMLKASEGLPVDIYFLAPSCVPATHFETSGGSFTAEVLARYKDHPRVVGLAEFMNVPGLLSGDEECLKKISLFHDRVLDGHAPGLSGKALSQYIAFGVNSDHETVDPSEGLEKLRKGMFLYLREGTSEKNMLSLLPLVKPERSEFFSFATDDRSPSDLAREGHIDDILRKGVKAGFRPEILIKMASFNAFRRFWVRGKGAVAPGYDADIVIFEDLEGFGVFGVLKRGSWVYKEGDYLFEARRVPTPSGKGNFRIPDTSEIREKLRVVSEGTKALVIELIPGQIVTGRSEIPCERGREIEPPPGICKVAVIERHRGTGNVGVGLLKGLGIEDGAIGTTIAHDSHNLIVAGTNDEDMLLCAETLKGCGGGLAVVKNGNVLATLSLPVGGLMSDEPFEAVAEKYEKVKDSLSRLGSGVMKEAFMALSFVALPVIPSLRVTDKGLFDVEKFSFVPLTG